MVHTRWATEWRHDYANLALGGGNLLILFLGFQMQSRLGWQISFALVGLTRISPGGCWPRPTISI